ncbi:MAG: hypothetical protein AAFV54_07335 [Pseudomonadota bacterium]
MRTIDDGPAARPFPTSDCPPRERASRTKSGLVRLTSLALSLLSSVTVPGCVGYSSLLGTERTSQQFAYYQAGRDGFVRDKDSAIAYWGEPLAKAQLAAEGEEEWTYRGGVAWRGVALWVVVPIPLVAPVGYNTVKMRFSAAGDLISGNAEQAAEKGFVCWILILECNPDEQL